MDLQAVTVLKMSKISRGAYISTNTTMEFLIIATA